MYTDDEEYYVPDYDSKTQDKLDTLRDVIHRIEKQAKTSFPTPTPISDRIAYEKELNPAQYFCATHINGPMLIIAGAGSGKTRTLVYRTGYMIEQGVDPASILLLTFTRRAAHNMLTQVNKLLGNTYNITGGTFHSFAHRCLRSYSAMLEIPSSFIVLDASDSEDIINMARKECSQKISKEELQRIPKAKFIHSLLGATRNNNISIKDYTQAYYPQHEEYISLFTEMQLFYETYKKEHNQYDFDDLLSVFNNAMKTNNAFKKAITDTYTHIMVDEYQDTNSEQYEMVMHLKGEKENVCVVGDDAQSIYAFRGARYENIFYFGENVKDCCVVKLEENYRSTKEILDFTNDIINQSLLGYVKHLTSTKGQGEPPHISSYTSQENEAKYIVDTIIEMKKNNIALKDIAILVRNAFHARSVEVELVDKDIPYVKYGGVRFTDKAHVRDVVSYLRIAHNVLDTLSWNRVLQNIEGVGVKSADSIIASVKEHGALHANIFIKKKYIHQLQQLELLLTQLQNEDNVFKQCSMVVEWYTPVIESTYDMPELRIEDLSFVLQLSSKYDKTEDFLSHFTLNPPQRFSHTQVPIGDEEEVDTLTVSTVHSAKGLEWEYVFVAQLVEGRFPSALSFQDIEQLEEERRLFYVASTRAAKELYLTTSLSPFAAYNNTQLPSRFLGGLH